MKRGHRLTAIPEFPRSVATELGKYSITTAEEFLAQVAVGRADLRSALPVDDEEFDHAISLARETTGPAYDSDLERMLAAQDYSLGALAPTSEGFNQFLRQQEHEAGGGDDDQEGRPAR